MTVKYDPILGKVRESDAQDLSAYSTKAVADVSYYPITAGNPLNGFVNETTDSTMSWNEGTRTLTITPVGASFDLYSNNTKYTKTVAESVIMGDIEGLHYFYYGDDGVLAETVTFNTNLIMRWAICAVAYWDATNKVTVPDVQEERHGMSMPSIIHLYNHLAIGVKYESGLVTSLISNGDGTLSSHSRFSGTSGYIQDEDIRHTIPAHNLNDNLIIIYRNGASGYWRNGTLGPDLVLNYPSGRAYFNEYTGGAWQLTQMGEGNYQVVYVYCHPGQIHKWLVVMGQAQYSSLTAAQAAALVRPNLGALPAPEYKLVSAIIIQTSSSYVNSAKTKIVPVPGGDYVDWRELSGSGSSAPAFTSGITAEIEIDFGTIALPNTSWTITDSSVTLSSKILVFPSANPATGRKDNDWSLDSAVFTALSGSGQFTLYAAATSRMVGLRKVYYQVV